MSEQLVMKDARPGSLPFVCAKSYQDHNADDEGSQDANILPCPRIATETETGEKKCQAGCELSSVLILQELNDMPSPCPVGPDGQSSAVYPNGRARYGASVGDSPQRFRQ